MLWSALPFGKKGLDQGPARSAVVACGNHGGRIARGAGALIRQTADVPIGDSPAVANDHGDTFLIVPLLKVKSNIKKPRMRELNDFRDMLSRL